MSVCPSLMTEPMPELLIADILSALHMLPNTVQTSVIKSEQNQDRNGPTLSVFSPWLVEPK